MVSLERSAQPPHSAGDVEPDLLAQLLHGRELERELQHPVDDLVHRGAVPSGPGSPFARARADAGDVVDADRLDLLGRLHHLLDDAGQRLDACAVELEADQLGALRVLRFDEGRGSFSPGEKLVLLGAGPRERRPGLGLGHRDQGAGLAADPGVVHFGLLGGADERKSLVPLRHGGLARGLHLLLGPDLAGARRLRLGLGPRLLDALRGQRHRVVGLRGLRRELGIELLAAQLPVALDLGQAHLALAGNSGRLAAALRGGLLLRDVGLARGPRGLDLALLGDRRLLLLLGEEQPALGGVELALVHRDLGVRLDRRAFLLVGRDDLGEAPHAERVEGVVLVERVERGLVQPGEGDRFEPEAVLGEVLAQHPAHVGGVLRAFVLQALHAVAGRHREHRVHELPFQRLRELGRAEGLAGQRLGGRRDPLLGRLDPDVELRPDVDPQPIPGDHRVRPEPLDLELRGPHVDLGHLVQERERETAAVEHHPLPAETGAHQRPFAGGLAVVAIEKEDAQTREHEQDDDGEEPGHRPSP